VTGDEVVDALRGLTAGLGALVVAMCLRVLALRLRRRPGWRLTSAGGVAALALAVGYIALDQTTHFGLPVGWRLPWAMVVVGLACVVGVRRLRVPYLSRLLRTRSERRRG